MTDLKNILNNKSNYLKECVLTDNGVLIKEDSIKKRNRYVKLILYDKYNENNSIEVLLQIIKKKSTGVEFKDINLEPSAITFITLMRINEGNYIQELILNQYKKIYKAFNLGDIKKDSSSSSLSKSSKITSDERNLINISSESLRFYTMFHYLLKNNINIFTVIKSSQILYTSDIENYNDSEVKLEIKFEINYECDKTLYFLANIFDTNIGCIRNTNTIHEILLNFYIEHINKEFADILKIIIIFPCYFTVTFQDNNDNSKTSNNFFIIYYIDKNYNIIFKQFKMEFKWVDNSFANKKNQVYDCSREIEVYKTMYKRESINLINLVNLESESVINIYRDISKKIRSINNKIKLVNKSKPIVSNILQRIVGKKLKTTKQKENNELTIEYNELLSERKTLIDFLKDPQQVLEYNFNKKQLSNESIQKSNESIQKLVKVLVTNLNENIIKYIYDDLKQYSTFQKTNLDILFKNYSKVSNNDENIYYRGMIQEYSFENDNEIILSNYTSITRDQSIAEKFGLHIKKSETGSGIGSGFESESGSGSRTEFVLIVYKIKLNNGVRYLDNSNNMFLYENELILQPNIKIKLVNPSDDLYFVEVSANDTNTEIQECKKYTVVKPINK